MHPKHLFKLIGKKIVTILRIKSSLIWTFGHQSLMMLIKFHAISNYYPINLYDSVINLYSVTLIV